MSISRVVLHDSLAHPKTGRPLWGFDRGNGRVWWEPMGASPDDPTSDEAEVTAGVAETDAEIERLLDEDSTSTTQVGTEESQDGETTPERPEEVAEDEWDALADPGKRALDRMKVERDGFRSQLEALQAQVKNGGETDEVSQRLAASERATRVNAVLRVADKMRFQDSRDAVLVLGSAIDGLKIAQDGLISDSAIRTLIESRTKNKQYLFVPKAPKGPETNVDQQGHRKAAPPMTPQGNMAYLEQAYAEASAS